MKTIAIDIDEVLARHNQMLARFHNERYGTSHSEEDYFTDHWSQVWKVTHEEAERRAIEFHDSGAHARLETVPGALLTLKKLREHYRLVAVTVRRKSIVDSTKQWLDVCYPEVFHDVRFVHMWEDKKTKTKAEVCQEVSAHWLIDDSLKHVAEMKKIGGEGLLFGEYAWNRVPILPDGVRRMKDWKAVEDYFL